MSRSFVLALLASSSLVASPAFAQGTASEPAESPGREGVPDTETSIGDTADAGEIVVSARKLGETVQDAPATITVLDDAQLAQSNVVNATQLNGIIPGVVQMNGVGGLPATSFRGVGSNSALFGVEASVPLYMDNVYLGRLRDFLAPVYDVDHVEFIKGTQSTLLGKNSTLGAISFVNRRPGNEFGYNVSYRHTFGRIDGDHVDGAINLPMGENLALRVSGLFDDDDGYVRNLLTGDLGANTRVLSGRVAMKFDPTDDLNIYATYQHDDRKIRGQDLEVLKDPIGAILLRQQTVGQTVFDTPADRRNTFGSAAFGAGPNAAPVGELPYDNYTADRLNGIVTYDLANGMQFTSQTAYITWDGGYLNDLDFSAANLLTLEDEQRQKQFTQEVRLTGNVAERLKYLVGAFYYHNKWNFRRQLRFNSPQGLLGPVQGFYDNIHRIKTESISPFASATFDITDAISIEAGARYTWEDKNAFYSRTGVGFVGGPFSTSPPSGQIAPPIAPTNLSRHEESFDYNAGVQFKPVEDLMLYASYSKGSKSGGFQEVPSQLAAAEYKGEKATTIEVGGKYEQRGLFNAAVALFQTKIDGFQANFTQAIGGVPTSTVGNADLRTRGVEVSGWVRPIDQLTVSASAVYTKTVFTSYLDNVFPQNQNSVIFPGQRAPRAPRFTAQIDANYTAPATESLDVTLGATLSHVSKTLLNNANLLQGDHPPSRAHQNLNLRFAVADTEKGWELALIGDNVLHQKWNTFATRIVGDTAPNDPSGFGRRSFYGTVNRPASVALRLTVTR